MGRLERVAAWGLGLLAAPSRWAQATRGTLRVDGLDEGAAVRRDRRGVPWVAAGTERDLYFAVGFAQATDRLWQMDVLRRRAAGRLSEVFGEPTLAEDVRARKLGFDRLATASYDLLGDSGRHCLAAFADGVNAALRRMRGRAGLPVEFLLLRYRPEPWTPRDSLMIVKHLGFDLGMNLKNEVFRARLLHTHPEYAESFLRPKYPKDGAVTVDTPARVATASGASGASGADGTRGAPRADGAEAGPVTRASGGAADALPEESRLWLRGLLRGEHPIGSNAWAVAGEHTAAGRPLLANDPHVLFTRPSLWYQMGLRLDAADTTSDGTSDGTSEAYGVTVPGLPGLIAGANRDLAWGITNSTVDTQDLCVLDASSDAARTWSVSGVIEVRGRDAIPVHAAGGDRHVEMDLPGAEPGEEPDGGPNGGRYGLFWSGLLPSAEVDGCVRMWRARDYAEFRDALREFGVPVLNVVVACRDGDIALKTVGRVPKRRPGSGLAPGPYIEVAESWREFLDFEELPEVVNPDRGHIVSANHKMVADDAPVQVGVDWVAPYRAERIIALIEGADRRVTVEDCVHWQGDVANGRAARVLPALLDALAQRPPEGALPEACHALLRGWNGRDEASRAAPLVFFRLLQVLTEHWVTNRLGERLAAAMQDVSLQVDHLVLDAGARRRLGDDEPLPTVVSRALTEAARRIAAECGGSPEHWRYDRVHRLDDRHPLAAAVPVLGALFRGRPTPVGGSGHSVCLMTPDRRGNVIEGAPWRFVAELGPGGPRLRDVLRHGSSGHPRSPHYEDQSSTHAAGGNYAVALSGPEGPSVPRLTLRPRRGDRPRRGG